MLQVTLLQVVHEGKDEALKLIPYIARSDIFSPEAMLLTEAKAREAERQWERILKSGMSLSEFQTKIGKVEKKEYRRLMDEGLFSEKRRLPVAFFTCLSIVARSNATTALANHPITQAAFLPRSAANAIGFHTSPTHRQYKCSE